MTFDVNLLITFVAAHPLVILIKLSQNPINTIMWEKKQIVRGKKEEEEKETTRKK